MTRTFPFPKGPLPFFSPNPPMCIYETSMSRPLYTQFSPLCALAEYYSSVSTALNHEERFYARKCALARTSSLRRQSPCGWARIPYRINDWHSSLLYASTYMLPGCPCWKSLYNGLIRFEGIAKGHGCATIISRAREAQPSRHGRPCRVTK